VVDLGLFIELNDRFSSELNCIHEFRDNAVI